jgi:hypothetical protein
MITPHQLAHSSLDIDYFAANQKRFWSPNVNGQSLYHQAHGNG